MAAYQAGFNAKVRINALVYVAASYQARDMALDQDVSNTEGIPGNPANDGGVNGTIVPYAESRVTSLQHMEATVRNATFDTTRNPFATPPGTPNTNSAGAAFNVGNYCALRIFVNGAAGVSWWSPSFLILEGSQEMDIQRLQPVSLSGKSDGWYQTPYQ